MFDLSLFVVIDLLTYVLLLFLVGIFVTCVLLCFTTGSLIMDHWEEGEIPQPAPEDMQAALAE